jgi:hypothetical protein
MKRPLYPLAPVLLIAALDASLPASAQAQAPAQAPTQAQAGRPNTRVLRAVELLEGTLTVRANAACELQVGRLPKQTLLPDTPQAVIVAPGETTIECTSTTVPEVKAKVVRDVLAGARDSVDLDLAEQIVAKSCAGKPATFADLGGGMLRHCVSKHDWTQADNGSDIDWEKAQAACIAKGASWAIPAADELSELIDRSGKSNVPCGGAFVCNVSTHFKLTAPTFWAREQTVPGHRLIVSLILGGQHPSLVETERGYRTLCIRRR